MPLYEYVCEETTCQRSFEKLQDFGTPNPPCPYCSSVNVVRCMGTPSLSFKGSGFYVTDYGGKVPPAAPKK